jgi:TPR repeat protein
MQDLGNVIRTLLLATIIAMGVGGTAAAGPFENADAAYNEGDYATAMRFWRALADQSYARAQYNLGNMYYFGQGIPVDNAEGRMWWHKAADQGHARAQFNLGNMYYFGEGVAENVAEAVKWYRKAADQGYAEAQFNFGLMYRLGDGVPQDDVQAYKWWTLAAAQGNENAITNTANAAKKMTREQIAEAQRLSAEWNPVGERD